MITFSNAFDEFCDYLGYLYLFLGGILSDILILLSVETSDEGSN